jgi:hypothetical protein
VALLVVSAVVYTVWNAGPAYLAHYELKDYMMEVARSPRGTTTDEKILDMLDAYARREQLNDYMNRHNFKISTREGSRTITVTYERQVKFLPGVERNVLFEGSVEQTLLF